MSTSPLPILRRSVPSETFERLCYLCQQVAEMAEKEAIVLTEAALSPRTEVEKGKRRQGLRFCLILSPKLTALLVGETISTTGDLYYQISLTCDRQNIAHFIEQLNLALDPYIHLLQDSECSDLSSNFFLNIFNLIFPQDIENLSRDLSQLSTDKNVDTGLQQQVAQERLINQVIAQIHQSLDLSVILDTAVREVRNCLNVDRLIVYQFNPKPISFQDLALKKKHQGRARITYESRVDNTISSLLNFVAEEDCFTYILHFYQKYSHGSTVSVEDVETAYSSSFCLTELLRYYQVKSKLIAPIIVQGELWGLLIAHQCHSKRQWLENEKNFLAKIGEHLAVAIYQAQLYAQVQEQKKTVEQQVIERTQELRDILLAAQAAHRSKSEFLGNISHELRSPLTSVIGLSGTLLHWSQQGSNLPIEKQQKYLKTIHESGQELLNLIDEILDLSQIEAGKKVLNLEEIDLKKIGKKIYNFFQKEAKEKEIDLQLDFRVEEAELSFFADPERLEKILFHLLKNAIKFTPERGNVILRIWRERHYVIFQVEDTGIGIDKQHLPLLFEKFQQLEKSRERIYGGTGLGLALTKQLVELHQGRIEVESTPGKGSLFTVWLPNQSRRSLKAVPNSSATFQSSSQSKSVVLVTIDEEIATLICQLLTAAEYQVVWLIDSLTAIRQIELLQPNAVILDRELPEIYSLSQSLKRLQTTRLIKVLLLSDRLDLADWQTIYQWGVDDYLLKPIQPSRLLKRLELLLFGD